MENIISYLRSLAPVYERADLLRALNQIQREHSETVTPVTNGLRETFGSFEFKSQLYKQFAQALSRHVNYGNNNPVLLVIDSLDQLQRNYPFLEKEVRRLFSIHITTANITYDRVTLLRYIEGIAFYLRYARKFFLNLVAEEAAVLGGQPTDWCKAEKVWMAENMLPFVALCEKVNKTDSQLKQLFSQASSAEVNEETAEMAVKTLGVRGTDPLRLGFQTPQRNVLVALGKLMAELQVKRYKAAKEELYGLQLRLQEMRELMASGKAKPQLQKLITLTEQRIEELDAKVAKFEEENAFED